MGNFVVGVAEGCEEVWVVVASERKFEGVMDDEA